MTDTFRSKLGMKSESDEQKAGKQRRTNTEQLSPTFRASWM